MMEVVLARIRYRRKVSFRCVNKLYHCSVVFLSKWLGFARISFVMGKGVFEKINAGELGIPMPQAS